jgi:hypothetical protein
MSKLFAAEEVAVAVLSKVIEPLPVTTVDDDDDDGTEVLLLLLLPLTMLAFSRSF